FAYRALLSLSARTTPGPSTTCGVLAKRSGRTMRIRVLSGCLAISTVAIIGTGAAAQAAQAATLSSSGGTGGGNNYQTCPPGEQYSSQKKCCKPTPTPPPPCQCQTSPPGWQWVVPPTPTPVYTTPTPVYTTPTPVYSTVPVRTPTPVYTTASPSPTQTQVVPVVESSSPVPSGPANTGGGMAGGSNIPLAAGGGAVALIVPPLAADSRRRVTPRSRVQRVPATSPAYAAGTVGDAHRPGGGRAVRRRRHCRRGGADQSRPAAGQRRIADPGVGQELRPATHLEPAGTT